MLKGVAMLAKLLCDKVNKAHELILDCAVDKLGF